MRIFLFQRASCSALFFSKSFSENPEFLQKRKMEDVGASHGALIGMVAFILIIVVGIAVVIAVFLAIGWPVKVSNSSSGQLLGQGTSLAEESSVSISNLQFYPSSLSVPAGATVTWINNESNVSHTVTADDGSWSSGVLQPGGSYSYAFPDIGSYSYHSEADPNARGIVLVY